MSGLDDLARVLPSLLDLVAAIVEAVGDAGEDDAVKEAARRTQAEAALRRVDVAARLAFAARKARP